MSTPRHIIVTKQWPIPTGGGLGVARQFFLGLAEIGLGGREVWAICGPDVVQVKDAEACRHLADGGSNRSPGNRLGATICQIQAIRRLSKSGTTVIAFTPFYAWPALRLLCPRLRLIHVEQSKGGRHHELASQCGRFGWKERLVQVAVAMNLISPHKVIFPSRGAIDLFCEKNPILASIARRKGGIIHNGITPLPQCCRQQKREPFRILSVCEDVPEKSLTDCLQVISILKEQGCDIVLDHFGTVRDSTRLSAEAMGLPVVFHGTRPREEILSAMAEVDLFLHLPKVAVFDLVLIEAMSAGLPVVASPVGGNVEALGGDYPRFADHPESAAGIIRQLIKAPEEAAQLGETLRIRAEALFSASSMAGHYIQACMLMTGSASPS